MLISDPTC